MGIGFGLQAPSLASCIAELLVWDPTPCLGHTDGRLPLCFTSRSDL